MTETQTKHEYTPGEVHNHGHTHWTEEGHHPTWGQHIVNGRFGNIPLYGFEHTHAHTHPVVPEKEEVPTNSEGVADESMTPTEIGNEVISTATDVWNPLEIPPPM